MVLDDVPFDEHVLRVLELHQILHGPSLRLPRPWPRDVIQANNDVARHEIRDGWIAAAEHDVLAGCFKIVVLDEIRSGTIPPEDRLIVLPDDLEVGKIGVDDGGVTAVQGETAALTFSGVAMEITAIDGEVVGHHRAR